MRNNKINFDSLYCIFILIVMIVPLTAALIMYQPRPMDEYIEDTSTNVKIIEEIEIVEKSNIEEKIVEDIIEESVEEFKINPADIITGEKYLAYKESEVLDNIIIFTVIYDGSLSKLELKNNINSLSIKLKNIFYAEQTYESVRIMVVTASKNNDLVIYACENGIPIFTNM